jgi:hypothetical protein
MAARSANVAMRHDLHTISAVNGTVGIFETLLHSGSLWLTPNSKTVYTRSNRGVTRPGGQKRLSWCSEQRQGIMLGT